MRHTSSDANALRLLREAYSDILENYVEKPDSKKLVLKMVDGMLATLDPHSAYLPPEPYQEMEVQIVWVVRRCRHRTRYERRQG